MKDEPLFPYLFEIVKRPESEGMILAGGFGMRLKLAHLQQTNAKLLSTTLPLPRATADLDLFLRVQFRIEIERATAINSMLTKDLGYQSIIQSWHFRKPFEGVTGKFVKLDFQARPPLPDEPVKVKKAAGGGGRIIKQRQVGREMGTGLSGLETVEAFAIDHRPIVIGLKMDEDKATCMVPHPYAWLNLKLAAAYDWYREDQGEIPPKAAEDGEDSRRLKHVYDVILLVAMLTEEELSECSEVASEFVSHAVAAENRIRAAKLFEDPMGDGMRAAEQYARGTSTPLPLDHDLFWSTLKRALTPQNGD